MGAADHGAAADGAGSAGPLALWLVPVAETGGAARHVLDAARTGIPGVRLVVMCPEGPLAAQLRAAGAAVMTGPVGPADGTRAAIGAVRRVLARLRPDVLHTHLAFADVVGAAAVVGLRSGHGERIRLVSTEHGISGIRGLYQSSALAARGKAALHRARLRRTDAVIAVSESTREQVAAQWGSGPKVRVVRNGVEAGERAEAGERPSGPESAGAERGPGLRILSLARLAPEKRIDALLRAFAVVLREHPEARLTVAGTGPLEPELRSLAAQLGVAEAVNFPGHLEAGAALAEHDVVVQLSAWENLSYTLLDAVAHGLGVVATDVGGNREIVPARCLVDADDPEAVARAILAQGMDTSARPPRPDRAQSVADMCEEIARVYQGVGV